MLTRVAAASSLALVCVACTSHAARVDANVRAAPHLRGEWQEWVGTRAALPRGRAVERRASLRRAAEHWNARLVSLRFYRARTGRAAPAIVLAVADPASWLKHRAPRVLRDVAARVGPFDAMYVGVVDRQGRYVWETGHAVRKTGPAGGVWTRPDLDACQPVRHSLPVTATPPPVCPAR